MSYDLIKQVFCHQLARESSGDRATIVEFSAIAEGQGACQLLINLLLIET